DGGNPPDHTTIIPFTRMLSGPMDFTPGIFDLLFEDAKPNNRINTTLAKQLALYVVLYSPLQMAADLPENYEARPGPFQFIVDVPADWEDTQVLNGRIGDYITVVRKDRNSDDWYLGSITDEEGRVFQVPLHFLETGRQYVAEIYRDGDQANWTTNPYEMAIEKKLVGAGTTLQLRLAPGGGQAVRFRFATEEDLELLSYRGQDILLESYPNPARRGARVVLGLPDAKNIRLEVYDLIGRRVVLLANGVFDAGRHEIYWDTTDYSSGIYFYRLQAGDQVVAETFLLRR
ncbi:MAG: glycoside hydrolase family 97 catalytic domain-containing protein, partial [Bacteroidetes bacterium]|nr:glycoside hydrolase family 97 catalytic domain-containing protein [Bacteroidota bacterium]